MKRESQTQSRCKGLTLIEMSLVICVLLALMCTGLYFTNQIKVWQAGKEAAEALRGVYAAQRQFLADNPTAAVSTLTEQQIIPYLPNSPGAMPIVLSLEEDPLGIRVTVSPPVLTAGADIYDPSGSDSDSLWDVGE